MATISAKELMAQWQRPLAAGRLAPRFEPWVQHLNFRDLSLGYLFQKNKAVAI